MVRTGFAVKKSHATSTLPAPGTVFAVPLADGRFGMVRVLALEGVDSALIAVSPWIGHESELAGALEDVRAKQVLSLTHHEWKGEPQILWVSHAPPETWRRLGVVPVDPSEVKPCSKYGNWDSAELQPLERWDNQPREKLDSKALTRTRAKVRLARLRAARRKKETLAALLRKRWFQNWTDAALGTAAKKLVIDAIGVLQAGVQPKELDSVLSSVRGCVEALNRLNLERGGTGFGQEEREDLVEALLRMGLAAGVEEAAVESVVDASRTW
jgi:hypothetical protein